MDCKVVKYSGHAISQMFKRRISQTEVDRVIISGETIKEYPGDKPYPSRLLLGFANRRPLHVVIARNNEDGTCIIITAYVPAPDIWADDFKKRR